MLGAVAQAVAWLLHRGPAVLGHRVMGQAHTGLSLTFLESVTVDHRQPAPPPCRVKRASKDVTELHRRAWKVHDRVVPENSFGGKGPARAQGTGVIRGGRHDD